MTRITNAEQVLLLLRAQLQRAQKARNARTGATRNERRAGPLERTQGLVGAGALSESDAERALVAGLLEREFGAAVANDPKFQQVVDEVLGIIRADETSTALLRSALEHLTTP